MSGIITAHRWPRQKATMSFLLGFLWRWEDQDMEIRREGCFVVVNPGEYKNVLLQFAQDHLVTYKREYDIRNKRVKTRLIKLFAEREAGYLIPVGFLFRLTRYLNERKIPYTYEEDKDRSLTPYWEDVRKIFTPRPLQEDCLRAINTAISRGFGGVVVAPPAFGKSYLISMLSQLYRDAKIDVISRRRDVVLSVYNAIQRVDPQVGLVTTGSHTKGERVTVYTAGSLKYSSFDADLVILDEVHELVTDNYFRVLCNYDCQKLGLTATVDTRYDNMHSRIEGLCGPVLFKVNYEQAESVSIVVPIAVIWYPVTKCRWVQYTDPVRRKRFGIWRNEERNKLIAEIARSYYREGKQTLILTETIEHVLELKKLLPEFEVCYAGTKTEGFFPANIEYEKITPKQREELRQKFLRREIMGAIATGVWAVGVSFDDLEVLIRAEGSGSKTAAIQVPGRVSRISKTIDKPVGIVVDFLDIFEPGLFAKSRERFRMYARNGWIQVDYKGSKLHDIKGLKFLSIKYGYQR